MGVDKAFLRFGQTTLLEHLISVAKQACRTVALVGDKQRLRPYGWVIEDIFAGQGPLAGIHAALCSTSATDFNLFLAVDTPCISPSLLKYLLKVAEGSGSLVTVPCTNGLSQPLCAVYRPAFAEIAAAALKAGRNKIDPLYAEVPTRKLDEAELEKSGFSRDMFENVNTPEDWDRLQSRFGALQR